MWVRREIEQRQLQEEHNNKTAKMAALLEAAATGRLWSKQAGDTLSLQLEDIEDDTELGSRTSTARKVVRATLLSYPCCACLVDPSLNSHGFLPVPGHFL